MKKIKIVMSVVAVVALVGCGGDEVETEQVTEAQIEADISKNIDESALPDLQEAMNKESGVAAAAGGAPAPGLPGAAPAAKAGVDAIIQESEDSDVKKTPLQLMQQAIDFYHDPAERGVDDMIENMLSNMEFETEQGEDRARKLLEEKYQIQPLQSLDGLVKAKVLAKIPPAPDGKQWKYDPDSKKVTLE